MGRNGWNRNRGPVSLLDGTDECNQTASRVRILWYGTSSVSNYGRSRKANPEPVGTAELVQDWGTNGVDEGGPSRIMIRVHGVHHFIPSCDELAQKWRSAFSIYSVFG